MLPPRRLACRCRDAVPPALTIRRIETRNANEKWRIPAARMKMCSPHLVPSSRQAVEVIVELKPFTGGSHLLFPSALSKEKPMSDNTVNAVCDDWATPVRR